MHLLSGILGALLFMAPFAYAQSSAKHNNDSAIIIQASECEKLSQTESVASVRSRATDKAILKALEKLPSLQDYRRGMDLQEFNTKVYRLADNYLTDLRTNTSYQDSDKICVEANAVVLNEAIEKVFADHVDEPTESSDVFLHDDEIEITMPPKPQIVINEEIAYDNSEKPAQAPKIEQTSAPTPHRSLLIARTEFFDGNSTSKFFDHLKNDWSVIDDLEITNKAEKPDYTLKTKVLQAKVDRLNANTNRLRVVVEAVLIDNNNKKEFVEHQNRFVLFAAEDDAQKTAVALVKKLFNAATSKLSLHIKKQQNDLTTGLISTPNK